MTDGKPDGGCMLVPTDGSNDAANALAFALQLARASGAVLAALYVAKPGAISKRKRLPAGSMEEFAENDPEAADEARLAMMPARVWAKTMGVRVELLAARGDPAQEIVGAASSRKASLIVMGTHGKTAASGGRLMGSVARAVFTASPVPTIVIPPKAVEDSDALARDLGRLSESLLIGPRIVAAFDGGPGSEQVVLEAVRLAAATHGSVHLFSGSPTLPGDGAAQAYHVGRDAGGKAGVSVSTDRGMNEALPGLLRKASENAADLIVVGTRAAPGHTHDHLGSFTDRLLAEITVPVEVLRLSGGGATGAGQGARQ